MNNIDIYWQGLIIQGNNKQILLEQLERAGIYIPYSCRLGICGNCRIKLIKGDVYCLKNSLITNDNTILCCICIPKTSIQIKF